MKDNLKITFDKAADKWDEALPIGNGKLGGMVYGYPFTERIQLNEDSVWYGGPQDRNNPSALEKLPKIRELIFEGRIKEAQELCALSLSGIPEEQRHYEPLGNLYIEFDGSDEDVTDYMRTLDLDTATEAEKILGIEDIPSDAVQREQREGETFIKTLENELKRIAPIRVGRHGQIMEWNEDYEEAEPGHRHISQLFALYPGSLITESTPELFSAAGKTIERRLANGGGHSGWSRAWIINMYARLGEGDLALENIEQLIETQTLPNLFDDHPPFQIDGNFGCTAGIAEMLVQSHAGEIKYLPALPKAWKNGRVCGLRVRGGGVIEELVWRDGKIVSVKLKDSGR